MAAAGSDDEAPTVDRRRRSTLAVVVAATLVAAVLAPLTAATTCDTGTGEDDDWRPPSTVEVVLRAQSVIYGHVRHTYPDESFNFGRGSLVYTARMEVYCTLKGRRLERVVNVSRAGTPSNIPTLQRDARSTLRDDGLPCGHS